MADTTGSPAPVRRRLLPERVQAFLSYVYGPGLLLKAGVWLVVGLAGAYAWDWIAQAVANGFWYLIALPIGVGGAYVGGVLIVLIVLAFLESSPVLAMLRTRPQAPAAAELQRARAQLAELGVELHKLKEVDRWRAWWMDWRLREPTLAPLSVTDIETVRQELSRLEAVVGPLARALGPMIDEVIVGCYGAPERNAFLELTFKAHYEETLTPAKRAFALFRDPESARVDPRAAFMAMFMSYQALREWLDAAAVFSGRSLPSYKAYPAWHKADTAFFEELRRLPRTPAFMELISFLDHRRRDGFPSALAAPLPPAPPLSPGERVVIVEGKEPRGS